MSVPFLSWRSRLARIVATPFVERGAGPRPPAPRPSRAARRRARSRSPSCPRPRPRPSPSAHALPNTQRALIGARASGAWCGAGSAPPVAIFTASPRTNGTTPTASASARAAGERPPAAPCRPACTATIPSSGPATRPRPSRAARRHPPDEGGGERVRQQVPAGRAEQPRQCRARRAA